MLRGDPPFHCAVCYFKTGGFVCVNPCLTVSLQSAVHLTTKVESLESHVLRSGSSSVVEHRLAKARVASSNLVSRSMNSRLRRWDGGRERSRLRRSRLRGVCAFG